MRQFVFVVQASDGIHAVPACKIAREAECFVSHIFLNKNGREARADNVIDVMNLCARSGESITVTVEGPDEEEASRRMQEFLKREM